MKSSHWPLAMILAAGFAGVATPPGASSAQDFPAEQRVANLQEQLESGLKARRDVEFDFIARVVALVEERQFSEGEVKSIFQWARRKNLSIPFPYFERAMRILALQKQVEL